MHVGYGPHLCDVGDDLVLRDEGVVGREVADEDGHLLDAEHSQLGLGAHRLVEFRPRLVQPTPARQGPGTTQLSVI